MKKKRILSLGLSAVLFVGSAVPGMAELPGKNWKRRSLSRLRRKLSWKILRIRSAIWRTRKENLRKSWKS